MKKLWPKHVSNISFLAKENVLVKDLLANNLFGQNQEGVPDHEDHEADTGIPFVERWRSVELGSTTTLLQEYGHLRKGLLPESMSFRKIQKGKFTTRACKSKATWKIMM